MAVLDLQSRSGDCVSRGSRHAVCLCGSSPMIVGSLRAVSLVLAWSLFLVASTSDYLGLSKSLVAGMRLVELTVG